MASKIGIANQALGELGESPLSSLSQVSLAADTVNTHYEKTIKDLLGKADWHFARVLNASLSRDVWTPDATNRWAYRYTLPATMVRFLRASEVVAYEIAGGKLYTGDATLHGDYIDRVSESVFPPPFEHLCDLELAVRMCMTITGDVELKKSLQTDTRLQFAAALSADAMQQPGQRFVDAPFINCRQ